MKRMMPRAAVALLAAALMSVCSLPQAHDRDKAPSGEPDLDAWREEILALHQRTIDAHWNKDARFFADHMADGYFALKKGEVLHPTREETVREFEDYLGRTAFTEYRDLRPLEVGFSKDGSIAWSIAQVKVAGRDRSGPDSGREFALVWAWITLYEREDGRWIWLGESSSFRQAPSPSEDIRN